MKAAVTAGVILLFYFGAGVFDHDIWSPTEPTVAGVVWNMYEHGELAVPRINEFEFLQKPPLYYWMALGVVEASGVLNAAALRLPSVLMGLGSLALVYWIGRRRYGESVACVLSLMGAVTVDFYMLSHRAGADIAAIFFCFLCFALFARTIPMARGGESGEVISKRTVLLCDVAAALALAVSFYAKNFYSFLIVVPPVTVFLLWRRELGRLFRLGAITAVFLTVLLIPWCIGLYESGGTPFLRAVFFDNTIGRFFTITGHEQYAVGQLSNAFTAEKGDSPFFYLGSMFVTPAPWTLIFLVALIAFLQKLWRARSNAKPVDPFDSFLAITFVSIPLLLSLSSSKASQYLGPILIVDLWMIGDLLSDHFEGRRGWKSWEKGLVAFNLLLVGVVSTIFPVVFAAQGFVPWPAALLSLPLLAAAVWLFLRLRQRGLGKAWTCEVGWAVIVAVLLAMIMINPELDRRKSHVPFFEAIEGHIEGRKLYTINTGVMRLPMLNYFLRTRVEILFDAREVPGVLRGEEPAGVFISHYGYRLMRKSFDEIPGLYVYPREDIDKLVYLSNRSD